MKAAVRDGLPPVYERHQVHILNPAAGAGKHFEAAKKAVANTRGEMLLSERPGQVTELVRELFVREPYAHVIVYGGDGTVFETVNGIMQSGHGDTASFSVIPAGSGNDFSTHANDSGLLEKRELTKIDVVRTTCGSEVRYFANMMNIGFDCAVVAQTVQLQKKPFLKGSAAYVVGAALELFKKTVTDASIRLSGCAAMNGEPEEDRVYEKKILLTACANGSFCGGGFHALPYADLSDGYLDVLVVNDVSRFRFVKLVGDYRAGTYIDEHGVIDPRFRGVLDFVRCRRFEISGPRRVCLDGELFDIDAPLVAENIPGALWYAAL